MIKRCCSIGTHTFTVFDISTDKCTVNWCTLYIPKTCVNTGYSNRLTIHSFCCTCHVYDPPWSRPLIDHTHLLCRMWYKVADYAQRLVSISLLGLSIYGLAIMTKGGMRVMERRKEGKKAIQEKKKIEDN